MSIRSWDVPANAQLQLEGRVYPVVTQEDLIKALVDGAIALDRLGGCLGVVMQRIPTGVPNEMVTTRAIVTWQDRTNAKPQLEQDARHEAESVSLADALPVDNPVDNSAIPVDNSAPFDDGLTIDPEAVDESEVPSALRGS